MNVDINIYFNQRSEECWNATQIDVCEREWRYILWHPIVAVKSLSHIQLFVTPWTAACQGSLSFTISLSFLKLMSVEPVTPSNHLIIYHSFLLLPSIFCGKKIREFKDIAIETEKRESKLNRAAVIYKTTSCNLIYMWLESWEGVEGKNIWPCNGQNFPQ